MDRDGTIKLLCAILADLPRLDGASCRSQFALYDDVPGRPGHEQRQQRHPAAVRVCRGCPARPACPESLVCAGG